MVQHPGSRPLTGPPEPIDPQRLGLPQPATPQIRAASTFLLAHRVSAGATEVLVELRNLDDGRSALFAYSSLQRLVDCCGPAQPWVEIAPGRIHQVQVHVSADLVIWDAELPSELRHTMEDADA